MRSRQASTEAIENIGFSVLRSSVAARRSRPAGCSWVIPASACSGSTAARSRSSRLRSAAIADRQVRSRITCAPLALPGTVNAGQLPSG